MMNYHNDYFNDNDEITITVMIKNNDVDHSNNDNTNDKNNKYNHNEVITMRTIMKEVYQSSLELTKNSSGITDNSNLPRGHDSKDIKIIAWIVLNNDFRSRVRWFANNFHEWRMHEWKSLRDHITTDQK